MAKSKKQLNSLQDKAVISMKNEKITNDLLLQFAYTLTLGVISIFVYNAMSYKYGNGGVDAATFFMWALFGISLIAGVITTVLDILKKKNIFKIISIYSYITAAFSFWCVGFRLVVISLKGILPFLDFFSGPVRIIFAVFPVLGLAVIVEFVVYFIRYYSVNKKDNFKVR